MSQDRPEPVEPLGPRVFTIGRIRGVPLVFTPLWLVVAALYVLFVAPSLHDDAAMSRTASYLVAIAIVVVIYASILIHEGGHVLVAKALGLRVGRIVLNPFGGASEILDEPATPGAEFAVSAVGPLASILLSGIAGGLLPLTNDHTKPWLILSWALWSNVVVAIFNLLPGLPLDGGRIARAVVWRVTGDKDRGTLAAGYLGRLLALAMVIGSIAATASTSRSSEGFGITGTIYIFFIAAYINFNAARAISQAKVSRALPQLSIAGLLRKAMPVDAQLPVAEAIRRARIAQARALVVVDGYGKPQGLVSETAVMELPEQRRPWTSISDLARPLSRDVILRDNISGESLLLALANNASEYLVIADSGAIRGVLTRTDIGSALKAAGAMG